MSRLARDGTNGPVSNVDRPGRNFDVPVQAGLAIIPFDVQTAICDRHSYVRCVATVLDFLYPLYIEFHRAKGNRVFLMF